MAPTGVIPIQNVTRDEIASGLAQLGVQLGDSILVHSSLSSFGHVAGGADAVIDALLRSVGPEGTVLMPSLPANWRRDENCLAYLSRQPIFDVRVTPSKVGRISDVFWRRAGAKRSLSASHAVTAMGTQRDWFVAEHERSHYLTGPGTPWYKNCQAGGKIVLLGVTQATNTTLHTVEETAGSIVVSREWFYPLVIDTDGVLHQLEVCAHLPGYPRNFPRMDEVLLEAGAMRVGTIGQATVRVIEARKLLELGVDRLRADPRFLLSGE